MPGIREEEPPEEEGGMLGMMFELLAIARRYEETGELDEDIEVIEQGGQTIFRRKTVRAI